ncbi:MAG: calcium/sodium antiporter [Pseudomonadales bacterium]
MLTALLALIFGFIGLVWSADKFVAGAAASARKLGMSTFMIGLTVVAFGTSAPELLVAFSAALTDASALAVGNAMGSNLANIGLVLAVTALIARIPISKGLLRSELPVVLAVTVLAGYCLHDSDLSRSDGLLLLAALVLTLVWMAKGPKADEAVVESEIPSVEDRLMWFYLIGGLLMLMISSELLVWGAKQLAVMLGVSQLVIGLTVVAVGTSLPELAAAVMSAIRGHHDMALGNVMGSNIFNILAVMAVPGIINPVEFSEAIFTRDYLAMAGITFLLALMLYIDAFVRSTPRLGKLAASVLLVFYITYYYLLF